MGLAHSAHWTAACPLGAGVDERAASVAQRRKPACTAGRIPPRRAGESGSRCPHADKALCTAILGYYNYRMMHGVVAKSQHSRAAGNSDELVDAVLGASRALVAVAARSLATVAEDV